MLGRVRVLYFPLSIISSVLVLQYFDFLLIPFVLVFCSLVFSFRGLSPRCLSTLRPFLGSSRPFASMCDGLRVCGSSGFVLFAGI